MIGKLKNGIEIELCEATMTAVLGQLVADGKYQAQLDGKAYSIMLWLIDEQTRNYRAVKLTPAEPPIG